MYIEELEEETLPDHHDSKQLLAVSNYTVVQSTAKRILVGAGARFLFYPTLLYNICRHKIEPDFHWWDEVDQLTTINAQTLYEVSDLFHEAVEVEHENDLQECSIDFVILGAVPFPKDVPHLKQLGVQGVITLNEPYEMLVPTCLYQIHGIDHLMIPTRDYLFAPSFVDVCQAVDFIHKNASRGKTTYVHCKAGRGRSTTIVLCYLVQHKHMTPIEAYHHVRSSRPRVLLAACQWQAVQKYYRIKVMEKRNAKDDKPTFASANLLQVAPKYPASRAIMVDDGSIVMITESDLDGYTDGSGSTAGIIGNDLLADASFVCKVQFAGQAALARLSCIWLRYHAGGDAKSGASRKAGLTRASSIKSIEGSCSGGGAAAEQLGGIGVDIPVY